MQEAPIQPLQLQEKIFRCGTVRPDARSQAKWCLAILSVVSFLSLISLILISAGGKAAIGVTLNIVPIFYVPCYIFLYTIRDTKLGIQIFMVMQIVHVVYGTIFSLVVIVAGDHYKDACYSSSTQCVDTSDSDKSCWDEKADK